jgi:hypothetical protein
MGGVGLRFPAKSPIKNLAEVSSGLQLFPVTNLSAIDCTTVERGLIFGVLNSRGLLWSVNNNNIG